MEYIHPFANWSAGILAAIGIALILFMALYSLFAACKHLIRHDADTAEVFNEVRQRLGRGILLGLEFLIAADIMLTVAVELSFETVGMLVVIVLIRSYLSFTLEVELTGKWPWEKRREAEQRPSDEVGQQ
ncbi:DUF1622 domain-containing protein [Halopseudomonas nanhaiensis]|uniref:DUF1622 domain-containing protein n=1 Tax=Halopseudomonas nanhaiensis TaxID=2830842 RepID=UPI001CBD2123|nr:DUF1622 domain-containing protein [Halopseudomonas nanhaiensis]UAW97968.1 DUF1622 domain-containing protein [Halopseudomonas nanhaiensis]